MPSPFIGFPYIKGMFPLQREQAHIFTYSHSLFLVHHTPSKPTCPTNHRWHSLSGGFVMQQNQEAAQALHWPWKLRRPGTWRCPASCSSPWASQCWLPAHSAYHLDSWERWDTFISLTEECASSCKKQHNMKCKDYFSNKLNLCCTWLPLWFPSPWEGKVWPAAQSPGSPGKTMGSFSCQNQPSRSPS